MELKDIRWRQRFDNFERSYVLLKEYLEIHAPSKIERAGGVQYFEICFELSWKMLKDYLEFQGLIVNSPREAIKQSFQNGIIQQGDIWLKALEDRNLTTHTYDETKASQLDDKIHGEYFQILKTLYEFFKEKR
ncbi:MAG: nucleotidyltransferase substrate binding protein [Fusobacteria bacterium]|nr:nucleotidyltransferase substrate binding protein [Fusobacteriota bacterium]